MANFNKNAKQLQLKKITNTLYTNLNTIYEDGYIIDCGTPGKISIPKDVGERHRLEYYDVVLYKSKECKVYKPILLTLNQINTISLGKTPNEPLFREGGYMQCMGEAGGPPCYWVPDVPGGGIDIDDDTDEDEEVVQWYEEIFWGCAPNQLGYSPNDNCPNGFVCIQSQAPDDVITCCPPGQKEEFGGPALGRICTGDIDYCGDPQARNYNPFATIGGTVPPEYNQDTSTTLYPHYQSMCVYCDPANELGYGSVWTDCDSYCTDFSRWGEYNGGTWTKGDLNRDGITNVLDIVGQFNQIMGSTELTGGELACTLWAADINNDQNIDILDVLELRGPVLNQLPQPLKVLSMNVGHLYNLVSTREPTPTDCDDPRCVHDTHYEIINAALAESNSQFSDVVLSIPGWPECCMGWQNAANEDIPDHQSDFWGCNQTCTKNHLCRRTDEERLFDFINEQQPDVAIITELMSSTDTRYGCGQVSCAQPYKDGWPSPYNEPLTNWPESSCYQDGTEQINRILPDNYSVSCSDPIYTCIAVRDDVGYLTTEYAGNYNACEDIICETFNANRAGIPTSKEQEHYCDYSDEHPIEYPDWPINVGYTYLNLYGGGDNKYPIRVVAAHPDNSIKPSDDRCRTAQLKQVFEDFKVDGENMLIAGDLNTDPYRIDWSAFWGWDSPLTAYYVSEWIEGYINNWDTQPNVQFTFDVLSCGTYTFRLFDVTTSLNNFEFVLRDATGQDMTNYIGFEIPENLRTPYYDLEMIFDWQKFGFKVCVDDPPGIDWPHCVRYPLILGCGACSDINQTGGGLAVQSCNHGGDIYYEGKQVVTLRYYAPEINEQTGEYGPEPTPSIASINFDEMELFFPGQAIPTAILNWILGNDEDDYISAATVISPIVKDAIVEKRMEELMWYSPVDYKSIVTGETKFSDAYLDSNELFLQNVDSESGGFGGDFKVHNKPINDNPEITFEFGFFEFTFDYILSNFAQNNECETYSFPFMDHSAVICTLET